MPDLSQFDVKADRAGEAPDSAKYKSCYYRKPDLWITLAPSHPDAFADYVKQGWTPLAQYGEFRDRWSNSDELPKLETLFARGGAKEFCVDQILLSGWHRPGQAPYGAEFPQLMGLDHTDVQCPTCRKLFIKREHLENHEQIAHRALSSNNQLARTIAEAQGGQNVGLAAAVESLMQSQAILLEKMAKQDERFMALLERMAPPATPARKAS
jgi:hypothetical protein